MHIPTDPRSEVTVRFADAALVFALPPGATLEDLARRIAAVEERQFGEPLSIDVVVRH
jgi:hypothetical protein